MCATSLIELTKFIEHYNRLPETARLALIAYGNGLAAGCRLESESTDDDSETKLDSHSPLAS